MKNAIKWANWRLAMLLSVTAAAQEVPVILQVEVESQVRYGEDVTDRAQVARSPVPVPSTPALNFNRGIVIGDVVAVNGSPAKGAAVSLVNDLRLGPNLVPGAAISDATVPALSIAGYYFLKPNGDPIGIIFGMGVVARGMTIVGGTGAFVGARGSINPGAGTGSPVRTTSQAEDPSMRRINGGGRGATMIQLIPMFRPEVLIGANGPAVFHIDYSLVTAASPARAGETLIVYAKDLGPTSPSVNPGDPFPSEPFAVATSPVEVLVNGKASPAINQIGVPRTTDTYRVDFRVPDETAAGVGSVQISSAWVKGASVPIHIR